MHFVASRGEMAETVVELLSCICAACVTNHCNLAEKFVRRVIVWRE